MEIAGNCEEFAANPKRNSYLLTSKQIRTTVKVINTGYPDAADE
jgi:hypothetical protein